MIPINTTNGGHGSLYRTFWRWHFYAGLIVLPLLMLMALTGGVYLFKDEINGLLYRRLAVVEARPALTGPTQWASAVQGAVPGRLARLTVPAARGQAARLVIETPSGSLQAAYVDPHDGRFVGAVPDTGVMQTIKQLHSLDLAGPAANILVEIVAGWAIVLAATGVVLWWPRRDNDRVLSVRGGPGRRIFWRDLHALVGVTAAGVIIFLAATGMPWSAVWGKQVRALTTAAGWGRPAAGAIAPTLDHGAHKAEEAAVPWALQQTEMAGHHHDGGDALSLDQAVQRLNAVGLKRPYILSIPADRAKPLSAAYAPDRVEAVRTVYLDAQSGAVLADIGYRDYGPAAKAIEWGIAVHQGQQFGLLNKLVMLGGCIAIWLLGLSGMIMWWKRKPKGGLGAPPPPADRRGHIALLAVVLPLAIVYPLVGTSLCAVLIVDQIVRRLRRRESLS